jgi:hypothetical protein
LNSILASTPFVHQNRFRSNSIRLNANKAQAMATTYDPKITALLCMDLYNDFPSEGGKLFPWVKDIANKNNMHANLRTIIRTTRDETQTGKRNAGNPHVAFDVAGAGNVAMVAGLRASVKVPESPPAPTARASSRPYPRGGGTGMCCCYPTHVALPTSGYL